MEINKVSGAIIDSAMCVHTALGPGLLESTYHVCLAYELRERGFTERIHPIHQAQLMTYLKLSGKKLGLLINFNVVHLKEGLTRFVNGL